MGRAKSSRSREEPVTRSGTGSGTDFASGPQAERKAAGGSRKGEKLTARVARRCPKDTEHGGRAAEIRRQFTYDDNVLEGLILRNDRSLCLCPVV